jgi:hypothetical protein
MLRKSTAPEWLALCLISCVLGVTAPWFTDVSRLFADKSTGKVIIITFHSWLFVNLEQLVILSGIVSTTEVICWLCPDCVHYLFLLCCKVKNHVTVPFLFVGSTLSDVHQDFDSCIVG